jgi:hypothetical protein
MQIFGPLEKSKGVKLQPVLRDFAIKTVNTNELKDKMEQFHEDKLYDLDYLETL